MSASGTAEADEREVLADLIEAYERKHHAITPPDPVSAIEFAINQRGYTRASLGKALGGLSRLSDIMNRRRKLSMTQVLALHRQFQIPLESLITDSVAVSAAPVKRGRKPASSTSGELRRDIDCRGEERRSPGHAQSKS